MKEETLKIGNMPAILRGEKSGKVYIFVHGKCGSKDEARAFAEIACPAGFQVLGVDLPEHGERKGESIELTPWNAVPELRGVYEYAASRWREVSVRANSIGAYFSMLAFMDMDIKRALFVSPIVNMEKLITDMMLWAGVSEGKLREKELIETPFGETLSWRYLTYARENPTTRWRKSTAVLYGETDNLTWRETLDAFAAVTGAKVTQMDGGEHWFHTPEELAVLSSWERENLT